MHNAAAVPRRYAFLGEDCTTTGVGEDHANHNDDCNTNPYPLNGCLGTLVKKKTHVVSRITGKSGTIIAYLLCSLVNKTPSRTSGTRGRSS